MIPAARRHSIVSALQSHGALSVGELAAVLEVSPSTIRRDLTLMEDEGALRRTFGGAMLTSEQDDPLHQVSLTNSGAKLAIAQRAAQMVGEGQTVILDIGSTALALADLLRGRGLTVVTSSLPVFTLFAQDPTARILLLGGGYRPDYECTSGHMTVAAIREIRADLAFLGCSGVSPDGTIRDTTLDQVDVKRAILGAADVSILLADGSKFPGKGSYAVAPVTSVTRLVTDERDLGILHQTLDSSGTDVIHP